MDTAPDTGPKLLLDWHEPDEPARLWRAGAGAIVFHIGLFAFLTLLARLDTKSFEPPLETSAVKKYTPLVDPPFRLTQKDPNAGKIAKQVHLEDLLPKPEVRARTPTVAAAPKKTFQAPPANPTPARPKPAVMPLPEPPKYEASVKPPQALPPSVLAVPPPQIQPEEKPKLAFETPGQGGTAPAAAATRIQIPKPSVEDAIRSVARGGGGSSAGMTVGDADQLPSLPDAMHRSASPARPRSQVQLLSDPMGVDFKPYLIQVLATVKRNWFAVYPESARLGLRGSVALRFIIDREGKVPHLEVAMPSGATALDRAAVAGISASIPFPRLPAEFKGKQITLQFSFQYN